MTREMIKERVIIGYKLEPIFKDEMDKPQPNHGLYCLMSGVCFHSRGGRRDVICREVVDLMIRNTALKRVIREEMQKKQLLLKKD